jgi:hypothetical protein
MLYQYPTPPGEKCGLERQPRQMRQDSAWPAGWDLAEKSVNPRLVIAVFIERRVELGRNS